MKAFSTLALCMAAGMGSAQDYYREGFIVKSAGDTLKGLINDLEWNYNPSQIEFKETFNGQAITYTVIELKSFCTDRPACYESHKVKYDGELQETGQLNDQRNPASLVEAELFLEVVVKGEISLMGMRDKNNRLHFFLQDNKGMPEELLFRKYMGKSGGSAVIISNQSYKQALLRYASDNAELRKKIARLTYGEDKLKDIISSINTIRGSAFHDATYLIKARAKKPLWGVLIPLFSNKTSNAPSITDFSPIQFGAGVSLEIFSKKNQTGIHSTVK